MGGNGKYPDRGIFGYIDYKAQHMLDSIAQRKSWMIMIFMRFQELKGTPIVTSLVFKSAIPIYTRPHIILLQNLYPPLIKRDINNPHNYMLTNFGRKVADFYIAIVDGILKSQNQKQLKEIAEDIRKEMMVTKEQIDEELKKEEEDLARDDMRARLFENKPHVRTSKYEEVQS